MSRKAKRETTDWYSALTEYLFFFKKPKLRDVVRYRIPLSLGDLRLGAHPRPACGGALQMKTTESRSSKLVATLLSSFAVRGGFEPPVR